MSETTGEREAGPDMMPMSKNVRHAGMAGNVLLCNRCGARQPLSVPCSIDTFVELTKAWGKAHAKCRGDTMAFRQAATLDAWPDSDDTGMSSKAIYRHMRNGPAFAADFRSGGVPHPLDPSDFGRCYRLLNLAPDWRARITEMAQHGPEWAALSGAWDELTALYEEELPHGTAPRLYARMKALLDQQPSSASDSETTHQEKP